ncbi:MAG: (2Fe-2S)-binding protein [Gemmatimonadota bacterium]|jgi:aerobic-type carbon monoxide dehydrogenase small subunit (CoxS/CutS family)
MPLTLHVNGAAHAIQSPPETPLLWVLRDELNLTGVKYGCGISRCGVCTVHVGGEPVRSCRMSVSEVGSMEVVTIEGLSADGSHPVQMAWVAEEVPQCGYCQSGQVMAAAALLASNPSPSDADIDRAMVRNLCRCGTYGRIRAAIHRAAKEG